MKRIINVVLVIGSIISLALAFKFSAMPVARWLPDGIAELWISTPEEQQQYVLVYDLAVGFIMSAMFYFIVEEVPERVKLEKARKILSSQVKSMLWSMEVIISLVVSKYECSKDLYSLTEKDFLPLNGDVTTTKEEISYGTDVFTRKNNQRKTGFHQFGTLNDIVKNSIENILVQINNIKNYEFFYGIDVEFIECIKNIEGCSFIKNYRKDKDKPSDCFLFAGTNNSMAEFVNLYLQLNKMKFHTEYTKTILDTKKQTERYRQERESGKLIKQVIDAQVKQHKIAVENRILVIGGNKYSSQIIYKKMQQDLEAEYINISGMAKINWGLYKYIVVIVDSETYKIIDSQFQRIEMPINAIILLEQNFIPNISQKLKGNDNVKIVEQIVFKSVTRLGKSHVYLYKTEPSEKTIREIVKQIKDIAFKE